MPSRQLLLALLAVWILWLVAAVVQNDADKAARGVPQGERGGVSWFPVIPFFPLFFWWVAVAFDEYVDPWGSLIVGSFHGVLAVVFIVSIVRSVRRLRKYDRNAPS
jgi:hypothetical protein